VPACLLVGGKALTLAAGLFTLSWTHSVEKIEWQETWRVLPAGLEIVEARIKGSGAGMDPPPDAVLRDGWWHYRPDLPPLPALRLTRSSAAGDYTLCAAGECRSLSTLLPIDEEGAVTELWACPLRP